MDKPLLKGTKERESFLVGVMLGFCHWPWLGSGRKQLPAVKAADLVVGGLYWVKLWTDCWDDLKWALCDYGGTDEDGEHRFTVFAYKSEQELGKTYVIAKPFRGMIRLATEGE
jgi:hypothetical protein